MMFVRRLLACFVCTAMVVVLASDGSAVASAASGLTVLSSAPSTEGHSVASQRAGGRVLVDTVRFQAKTLGGDVLAASADASFHDMRLSRVERGLATAGAQPTPRLRRQLCRSGAGEIDPLA